MLMFWRPAVERDADRNSYLMMNPSENPLKVEAKEELCDDHTYVTLPLSSQQASGIGCLRTDIKEEDIWIKDEPVEDIDLITGSTTTFTPKPRSTGNHSEDAFPKCGRTDIKDEDIWIKDEPVEDLDLIAGSITTFTHKPRSTGNYSGMDSSKRTSPIGVVAKGYLLDLIRHEAVLHNKSTDGRIVLLKKQAWTRVAEKFDDSGLSEKMTEQQLVKVWERVKAKAKQDDAAFKQEVRKTGGGAPPTLPEDTAKVLTIIGSEVNDLGCPFDCDSGPLDPDVASPAVSDNTAITILLDEPVAASSVPGETTLSPSVSAPKPRQSTPKDLFTVPKKRKRKFSDDQPATLQLAEQQKLLLDEQLKVVKLQQEGERERNAEHVKLLKLQQEGERERNAEQVKPLKLQQEGKKLKILLLKQQLRKAQEGTLPLESVHEEWVYMGEPWPVVFISICFL